MFEKLSWVTKIVLRKIIVKILFIPCVNRWFKKIVWIYEHARLEKERALEKDRDMFTRTHEVGLDFSHYLPDTKERIERLRRVINKRPVAIMLLGSSITELEARITELEDCDICYFGVNNFRVNEEHILQKIDRNFSVVMCSITHSRVSSLLDDVTDFLERQGNNIFFSVRDSFRALGQGFDLDKFIEKYDRKLLFFTAQASSSIMIRAGLFLQVPSIEYPLHFPAQNSFSVLLSLAVIGQASMVVVFGGDGGRISRRELYFRESGSSRPEAFKEQRLMADTKIFNVSMPLILEKIYEIYNLTPVDIINCSVHSHYTPFRKLSYDRTLALLKSFKKDTDLTC